MAKKAKARSKSRSAKKSKSAKKAKSAKAVKKSAKKTRKAKARRAKPAKRRVADPCAQLRAVHQRLVARIAEIQELLSGSDLPEIERRRLQAELAQRQNQLSINTPLLQECERLHPPPRG
jgi:hypothetical protein